MSKSRDLGEFPAAALDIDASGNVNLTGDISLADNDKLLLGTSSDLQIYHDGANSYITETGTGNLYITASDSMFFQSSDNTHRYAEFVNGGAVKLRFDNSDKLHTTATGIDVTGEVLADGLNIDGSFTDLKLKTSGSRLDLWMTDAGTAEGNVRIRSDADNLSFITGLNERLRIDSSGNVGLGESSPSGLLHLKKASDTADIVLESSGGSGKKYLIGSRTDGSLNIYDVTASAERMRIDSAGHFLVNTTISLGNACTMRGNTNTTTEGTIYLANDGGSAVYASFGDTAGTITGYIQKIGSGVNYASVSDKRLKENITDSNDAGSKIDAIQVRQYDWKADGSHQDYGMIAQELISVVPDAVSGSENTDDMMGVDFSKLVPMLVKEVQSLRARVAALESK